MTKLLAGVALGALLAAGGLYTYHSMHEAREHGSEAVHTQTAAPAAGSVEDAASFLAETEAEIADFGEFAAHTA